MKSINFLIILVLALSIFSCKSDKDYPVEIRVKNISSVDFTAVVINTGGGEYDYGNLAAGKTSDYKIYDYAYRYAYINVEVDGEEYVLQPIDYVGESKLSIGKYTYQINFSDPEELTLTLKEE